MFIFHRLPTHFAARGGQGSILPFLQDNCADFRAFDDDDANALHYAAMSASVPTMRFLIEQGCDVNHRNYWGVSFSFIGHLFTLV